MTTVAVIVYSYNSYASRVRAEGSPVIRHLERFYIKGRNTVGEATVVCDMKV
jgi:hypothetical protein